MYELSGFYTLQEVCELTTLSERTIRRMMKNDRFPKQATISKRRVAWSKKSIHKWLALRDQWRKTDEDQIE